MRSAACTTCLATLVLVLTGSSADAWAECATPDSSEIVRLAEPLKDLTARIISADSTRRTGPELAGQDAFEQTLESLANETWFEWTTEDITWCDAVAPLFESPWPEKTTRVAFYTSHELSSSLFGVTLIRGYDHVWDLYHHEFAQHQIREGGAATDLGSVELSYANGLGFGLDTAADWTGNFATVSLSAGILFSRTSPAEA